MKAKGLIAIYFSFFIFHFSLSQTWVPFGKDTIGCHPSPKVASLYHEGDSVFVGGPFLYVSDSCLFVCEFGSYNGNSWRKYGDGFYNGEAVQSIIRYHDKLYAGGGFNWAKNHLSLWDSIGGTSNFARWNESQSTWEAVPNSYGRATQAVSDLVLFNDWLILGGAFHTFGTTNFWSIAAYNDTDYINIGAMPGDVRALEVYNGSVYAGGIFFTLKKYVGGTTWEDVGGHVNYYIQDMCVDTFNNFLYITGGFTIVDDSIVTDRAALWNGYYWEKVGYGIGGLNDGLAIADYKGNLYMGLFTTDSVNGEYVGSLICWDGENWVSVGHLNYGLQVLKEYRDTLWVGGVFTEVDGQPQKAIARYVAPLTSCNYLKPRAFALADTFFITAGNAPVQFFNNNAYADAWQWDFGDGGSGASTKDATHNYTLPGTYTATVTVTHDSCVKTAQRTVVIQYNVGEKELTRESLGFKLYPNPTSGDVTVECTLPANKIGEIKTHQTNGTTLSQYPLSPGFNKITLPASQWKERFSFVSVFVDGRIVVTEKVVKIKN
ncbi:MAG: PKD domain-containing protein [Bacteroidetes bacterium]|nr:PKD domain-containing protein [Bacteroidota bacterium]MBU1718133.1 PKD domain-containing protein [Bacteroidota bacterium]